MSASTAVVDYTISAVLIVIIIVINIIHSNFNINMMIAILAPEPSSTRTFNPNAV